MCYAKPGPRCTGHVKNRLATAQARLAEAKKNGDEESVAQEKKRLKSAQEDYALTPENIQHLEEQGHTRKAEVLRNKRQELIKRSKERARGANITQEGKVSLDDLPSVTGGKTLAFSPTGSRLYGLANADSDYDYVMIYQPVNATGHQKGHNKAQFVQDSEDIQTRSLDSFLDSCRKGSSNDLDVIFSDQMQFADSAYAPMLRALRPNIVSAHHRFSSMIEVNVEKAESQPEKRYKFVRHAFRVALNGNKLFRFGRYNPTHTQEEVDWLNAMTDKHMDSTSEEIVEEAQRIMDKSGDYKD